MNRADYALIGIAVVASLLVLVPLATSDAFAQTDFGVTSSDTISGSETIVEPEMTSQFEEIVSSASVEEYVFTDYEQGGSGVLIETEYTEFEIPPERIMTDENGETIVLRFGTDPMVIDETDEIIQITTSVFPDRSTTDGIITSSVIVFDKSTGAMTLYGWEDDNGENDTAMMIKSDSYVVRGAELNTDTWFNLEVNDSPITVESIVSDDNKIVNVLVSRSNYEGTYEIHHEIISTGMKTTAYFTNDFYPNHKIAFTQTLEFPDNLVQLNEEPVDLSLLSGQSFDYDFLNSSEVDELGFTVGDLFIQAKDIYFNAGLGFDNLWQVNVHELTSDGYYPVSLDWANVGERPTLIGETIELDPTYNWSVGSQWHPAGYNVSSATGKNISIDSHGHILMSDQNQYVWIFSSSGSFLEVVGSVSYSQGISTTHGTEFFVASGYTLAHHHISGGGGGTGHSFTLQWTKHTGLYGNGACNQIKSLSVNPAGTQVFMSCYSAYPASYTIDLNGNKISYWTPNSYSGYQGGEFDGNGGTILTKSGGSWHRNFNNSPADTPNTGGNVMGCPTGNCHLTYDSSVDALYLAQESSGGFTSVKAMNGGVPSGSNWAQFVELYYNNSSNSSGLGSGLYGNVRGNHSDNGIYYTVYGSGSMGSWTFAFPPTTPSAPSASTSSGTNTVTWSAVSGATSYQIYRDGSSLGTLGNVTTYSDSAQSHGVGHYYQIKAINSAGASGLSANSNTVTSTSSPSTPSAPSASTSNGVNSISWSAPSNNGSAITNYTVYRSPGGAVSTGSTATTYTHSNPTLGTAYQYQVSATNSIGSSNPSSGSNFVTPSTIPATPSAPTATTNHSNGTNTITWTAPSSNGATIDHYQIFRNGAWQGNNQGVTNTSWTDSSPTLGSGYHYTVNAHNSNGYSPQSSNSNVVFPSTIPATPTGVTATDTSNSSIALAWTVNSDNGATRDYFQVWRNGANIHQINWHDTASWTDTTTVNGTNYYYQILAHNTNGSSPLSSQSNTTSSSDIPATPSAPVAAFVSNTSNTITWTAPNANGSAITNYQLFKNGTSLTTLGNVLTHTETGITVGTSNYYTVLATNGIGSSPQSANSNTVVNANLPDAPQSFLAVSGSPITMSWTSAVSDATVTDYKIYRDSSLLTTVGAINTYTDTTGVAGNFYAYTVSAVSAAGEGAQSSSSTAATVSLANAPAGVTATNGTTQANVAWNASTDLGGGTTLAYKIYKNTNGGTYTLLTQPSGTGTSYTDTAVTAGDTYGYTIVTVNEAGDSPQSAPATTIIGSPTTAPLSLATTQTVPFMHDLSWTAPTNNSGSAVTNYKVYRDGSLITTLGNVTSYQDNTMQHIAHTHSYEVSAVNAVGESPKSNASSITSWNVPDATTGVTATARAGQQNELDWTAPASNGGSSITGYHIQSSTDNVTFTDVVASTTTQPYNHTGLTLGTTYYYKVSAISAVGEGTFGAASATVGDVPDTPVSLTVVPQAGMQMTITVTIPNDNGYAISSYTLHRSSDNFVTFTVVTPQASNVFVDYPLNIGTSYQYKALATNSLGDSALSVASATALAGDVPSTPVAPGTVVATT